MAQEQEQDRTEPATPFKLQEAKRRGQVVRSVEVNSLVVLAVALALAYGWGESLIAAQLDLSRAIFSQSHLVALGPESTVGLYSGILDHLVSVWWLLVAAGMFAAVLANVLQTGPVLSTQPLKPDFNRLNPTGNLKRLFSPKLLFETGKTVVKLLLFGGVLYLAIHALLPSIFGAIDRDPVTTGTFTLAAARGLIFKVLLVLLVVALIDLFFVRWEYARQMRMSRREMKEEVRRREGDPSIRAKMRELQKEAGKRAGSLRRVPEADVLITNPVRLAVALRYQRHEMTAPIVIAKGAGEQAARMRALAAQHRVTIVEDRRLARALYRDVRIDQTIPEEFFPVVARILSRIFEARRLAASNAVPEMG